jgi:beta-galactosidase
MRSTHDCFRNIAWSLIVGAWSFSQSLSAAPPSASNSAREHLSLDVNWRFHLGDDWPDALHLENSGTGSGPAGERFSDAYWRLVNLPHDWAVELPFDSSADGSHGFKALGQNFPSNSLAWYRRTFELPAVDSGKRIWLTFDGVFRDATVWVNGWCVRRHEGGYYPFHEDITDVLHFGGKNTIAVRVDATQSEGWFYEGAGIYRHVWLDKTAPVAIAPDGVFVYAAFKNNVLKGPATIQMRATLLNKEKKASVAEVSWSVLAPGEQSIKEGGAHQTSEVAPNSQTEYSREIEIRSPHHRFAPRTDARRNGALQTIRGCAATRHFRSQRQRHSDSQQSRRLHDGLHD